MYNVQLPGSKRFDSHMKIHTITQKIDVSLTKEPQEHLSKEHHKNGVIDQGKCKKICEGNWTYREYHVWYNADVAHKDVKMYCIMNQLSGLLFCGPHYKPHGTRVLSKHYH